MAATAAVALLSLAPVPARAADTCNYEPEPQASPRIVAGAVDGVPYRVLLPSDYSQTTRHYPVLYLLHASFYNEKTWLNQSDIVSFTAPFTGDRAAIVVMPQGDSLGFYADWTLGPQWETYHIKKLIPHIDATFRTIPDRAHRAVAGFSMGGFGAAHYAGRHPDLFVAVGSLSGEPDIDNDAAKAAGKSVGAGNAACTGEPSDPNGPFGDPALNDGINWRNNSPTDLAENYYGQTIYLAAGNGQPCDSEDAATTGVNFAAATGEQTSRSSTVAWDAALTKAHIPHVTKLYDCGLHDMRYATKYLHEFWGYMTSAFGTPPPAAFDYKTADHDFVVYGWHVTADPKRAPEFLDLRGASRSGVTLTGSGLTRVGTASYFKPRKRYLVTIGDARPKRIAATRDGRLFFYVGLGSPHAKTDGGPATTKQVTFRPAPRRRAGRRPFE